MKADKNKIERASIDDLFSEREKIDNELNESSWGCSYARSKELYEYRKEVQAEITRRGYRQQSKEF